MDQGTEAPLFIYGEWGWILRTSNVKDAEVGIYSFNHSTTAPIAQYEISLHQFRDPMRSFKQVDGTDPKVQEWISSDRRLPSVLHVVEMLAEDQVRAGKSKWLTIAFRDHHGKWISRAVAEIAANVLSDKGFNVVVHHAEPVKQNR
jgi:hypothetical protein